MPRAPALICISLLLAGCLSVKALDNGLAKKPPLGYNTWNCFGTNINEDLIKQTADLMVDLGLRAAGYEYLIVDDAWSERVRDSNGKLVSDQQRFPSGMRSLADYIHSKGLKFGMYSDAGEFTCAHYPGSRGHEEVDAQTFADWDVDYLKYDNCYAPAQDWVIDRYIAMRDALNKTGRPIVYSLCDWGVADPWLWAGEVGNSWRTTADIHESWESIMDNLGNSVGLARYSGPGKWSDPDMLEVGNGDLTLNEQRAHFALWALLKSPMLIGADLRRLTPATLAILKAREVLAINQDELGMAGDLIWKQGANEIYAGPLADGSRAVVMFNRHLSSTQYPISKITVHWEQLGYDKGTKAMVRDLYAERDIGEFTGCYTGAVDIHDVAALKITPIGVQGSLTWRPWHHQPMYAAYPEDSQVVPPEAEGSAGSTRKHLPGMLKGTSSINLASDM